MPGRLRSGLQGWRLPFVVTGGLVALLSSVFAGALFVSAGGPNQVEVRVFVDIAGDGLDTVVGDVNHPVAPGVDVHVWRDDGASPGLPDPTDTFVGSWVTDATGTALAGPVASTESYWVSIDSTDVSSPTGVTGVGSAVAEQTYGPAGSLVDLAAPLTAAPGPVYGGADPAASDIDASDISVADHLALIPAGSAVADFGFSFNVVTNTDPGAIQGSLRQFVSNANAIVGPNTMRFVPMVPANGIAGSASWWQVGGTTAIVVSDSESIIDGTAYAPDGSIVDPNPGPLSVNAGSAVGTGGATLPILERPELQIVAQPIILQASGGLLPSRSEIRSVHLGSGHTATPLRITGASGAAIADVVVDSVVVGTVDPSTVAPNVANASALISGLYAPGAFVRNSYLTEAGSVLIDFNDSPSPTITGSEMGGAGSDGFNAQATSPGMTVNGNLFFGANDFCVDGFNAGLLIEDNTFLNCGDSAGQSGGVRVGDFTATIRRNVFRDNNGPGIVVAGENTDLGRASGRAVISRNHFIDNAAIGIDNHIATTDNFINGDGITLNDGVLTTDAGNAFLDFPVITAVAPGPPGTVDVTGTSCSGCVVEIFSALPGAGETEPAVPLPHGEGAVFLASGTANGAGDFTINIPSAGVTEITATATDSVLGATSEFSQNSGLQLLSGRVLNDPNGDADMSDATPVAGVTIRVYQDVASDAPGIETPAAGDPLLATLTTDGTGRWTFANAISGSFWITVDSRTIAPSSLNSGFLTTDVWAEQTYGPAGSMRALGSGGVELTSTDGPVVGGRSGTASDAASSLITAEHVFRADAATPRLDLDTGFSFDVVTNLEGGDGTDLAPEGTRTVQGTIRQYVQNANAVAGPNTMRFVPAVPTNASGGGHIWWQHILTVGLPPITDADTTVDGNARQWNSPVNGVDGTATSMLPNVAVGANGQLIGTVDIPELLLWGNRVTEPTMDGLRIHAPDAVVENVAMLGFDDGVEVGSGGADGTSSATISDTALGFDIATQGDPGSSNRLNQGVRVLGGQQTSIQRNVIGHTKESGVSIESNQPTFLVERNQIIQPAVESAPATSDGVTVSGGNTGSIVLNHILGSRGGGIDSPQTTNALTISDNTVDGFGSVVGDEFGIRLYGAGSTVLDNALLNGTGSAIAVVGENAVPTPGRPGTQISVSGNTYGAIAAGSHGAATIDLIGPSSPDLPDGPTPNDGAGCGLTSGYGNQGLDAPVVAVEVIASSWHLTGTGCPNSALELYDGDFGTGLATSRIYQTVVQADGSIDETFPALASTHVTASQTNGPGSTSEFGPVVAVTGALPPVITNPGPQSATEGVPFGLVPVGSDPDSAPVVWNASGMPAGMTVNPGTGELAWTPSETDGGSSFSITLDLTGGGVTVSETFVLSVSEDDQPPVVAAIPDGSATVGAATVQPVTGSDPDLPAVALSWSLQGAVPAGMSIDPSSGTITFVPTVEGTSAVQVVATQPNLLSGSATWTITATSVATNSPPTVSPVPNRTVVIDEDIDVPIVASDPDAPLTYVVLVGPPGMSVDSSGLVNWSDAGPVGSQTVTIRVSDSGSPSMSTDVTFSIQVTLPPTTAPPVTTGGTTTTFSTSTSTSIPTTTTTTTSASSSFTSITSTATTSSPTTAPGPSTTQAPTTEPPPRSSLPIDESSLDVMVPDLGPPTDGPSQPTLSLTSGIGGLISAPGSFRIPPSLIGLAGAWIFVLGVPLVLWERKRAVSVVAGIDASESLPAYATRNSTYPFAYLRADASMLWSRYRFMGLGEGQRVKVKSPLGPVWVERRHLRSLFEVIRERET